ncbi:hypothetical protein ACVFI8_01345 [Agarivorans sp. MS3-6]
MYPIFYPKRIINAVTVPIFMLVCNWALAVNFGDENAFFAWFLYAFQFYAVSIYLTNCVLLVTKNEIPNFVETQSIYAKSCMLLTAYTFLVWGLKYCLVMLCLDIFGVSDNEGFSQLSQISDAVSTVLLFSLFLVIPHYICTGKICVKEVLSNNRKHLISLSLIIFIIEIFKSIIGYVFTGTSTPTMLLGATTLLIFQGVGYIAISFCYMSIFPNSTTRIQV